MRQASIVGQAESEWDEGDQELPWELGRRIVRLRRARGWSRDELARRVRVSPGRLGNWERGSHTPPLKALVALGRTLGVSMDELMTGEIREEAGSAGSLSRQERAEAARHLWGLNRWLWPLLKEPPPMEPPTGMDDVQDDD
jgi:transcriptional regulator with XRE-family HTH domain